MNKLNVYLIGRSCVDILTAECLTVYWPRTSQFVSMFVTQLPRYPVDRKQTIN